MCKEKKNTKSHVELVYKNYMYMKQWILAQKSWLNQQKIYKNTIKWHNIFIISL